MVSSYERTGRNVVAGVRTPQTIDHLNDIMPECYKFVAICDKRHYRDMQVMEFTIEDKLYTSDKKW